MKKDLSVNRLAWKLLEDLLENPTLYGVNISEAESGETIIDAGIDATGGFEAGRLITEICMGGCGKARITMRRYGDVEFPSIFVYTDHPIIAALGSQYAGWQVSEKDYFAIGSGPARALALKPRDIYEEIGYKDDSDRGIVVLETDKTPTGKLLDRITKDCCISHDKLAVILTPTTSMAGGTQVSGRIVETGVHKLRKAGLSPKTLLYAWGIAPIAPVHPKFVKAMARTNDAILYGGIAYYGVRYEDEKKLKMIVEKAPSNASEDYGRPFIEKFKEAEYDFYKIDPNLFAPAVVIVNSVATGNTFRSGEINVKTLKESFGLTNL